MRSGKAGNDGFREFDAAFDGTEFTIGSLEAREEKVRTRFWEKFRRVAAHIPFADDLLASYYCAMDPGTPSRVRGVLLGALAYFILPTDGIPDFVLGFGYTDDAAILAGVISLVAAHIQPKHRAAASKTLGKDLPDEGSDAES
ncbi:MAG: DUF1232 domain-containing protein [Hyphomicrobiaceae bacterium]|nr:DUF1232 domain-containing protein [Hyphomicrobiaceae bacterium]